MEMRAAFRQSTKKTIESQKDYFENGHTLDVPARIKALEALRSQVILMEDELCEAVRQDLGKSRFEGYASEVGFTLEEIGLLIKNLPKWSKTQKPLSPVAIMPASSQIEWRPLGQVLVISPWNYPLQLALCPIAGAIAAGNTCVLKPSEMSTHSAKVLEKLIAACLPEELCKVVQGGVEETEVLLEQDWDHIFFTGSTQVGKIVMQAAAKHLTPVTLELGGKSPCIVAEDANLDITAKRVVWGKFYNVGQTCVAPDYLLVHENVKDKLVEKIQFYIKEFFGENPQESDDYGHIINEKHFDRLQALLDGAHVLSGGQVDRGIKYFSPTLVDQVTLDHKVMSEEIFGPILPILTWSDSQEVIDCVRKLPNPLAFYLFTEDENLEKKLTNSLSFGGGCINSCLVHLINPKLPFGGVRQSGMGAYHGRHSFECFSHRRSIVKQSTMIDIPLKYPPYSERKLSLLKKLMK